MACSSVLSCKTSPFSIHQSKAAAAAAKSLQLYPTLWDPIDGSPPGSPVPGILQARILEWVTISFSSALRWKVKVKSLKSCPTLRNLMDCSLPGSSAHGIFQARVLEWGAIAFSVILNLGGSNSCILNWRSGGWEERTYPEFVHSVTRTGRLAWSQAAGSGVRPSVVYISQHQLRRNCHSYWIARPTLTLSNSRPPNFFSPIATSVWAPISPGKTNMLVQWGNS